MKKLAYVAGLFALTCSPLLAALYEGLEVGMDKDQVLKTLRRSCLLYTSDAADE